MPVSTPSLDKCLRLAQNAARKAGWLLKTKRQTLKKVNLAAAHDLKTQADIEAEKLIRGILAQTGIPVIGEEQGGDRELIFSDKLYWAVDPLDGTVNYVGGIPFSCVSIGLMRGMEPQVGVIYDFWHDEMFYAKKNGGAWLKQGWHTQRLETLKAKSLAEGVVADARYEVPTADKLQYLACRDYGSAALHMAYVACGRLVGFRHAGGPSIWDVAAGSCLLKELGYRYEVTVMDGFKVAVEAYRM